MSENKYVPGDYAKDFRQVFTFVANGSRWEFLSNFCMEQHIVGIGTGRHAGPVLPFRLAKQMISEEPNKPGIAAVVRYCVDRLGRVWFSVTQQDEYVPLDSPSLPLCLSVLKEHGCPIEEIQQAVDDGKTLVKDGLPKWE